MRNANLFGEFEPASVSIAQAAAEAGVSIATIRNWIKTGYLKKTRNASVEKDSLVAFMEEVAGKDKLRIRANKLYRDEHDHSDVSERIALRIATDNTVGISESYEGSLSNSYRNKEGIYYTPPAIVKDMFSALGGDLSGKSFLDPCCGSGNFLLEAVECGFSPENVHGIDIDPNAVAIAKKRLFERTGYLSGNIRTGDFLELASQNNVATYDHILTNPPWGKKLSKEERSRYRILFDAGKSTDTSSLFLLASLAALKTNGTLGFLLPGSFFNIATFEDARRKVLDHRIIRLTDYGRPFAGLLTEAQALILQKTPYWDGAGFIACRNARGEGSRTLASFRSNPHVILNFWASETESAVIEHAHTVEHITLAGRAKWGLGLVTGNNAKFIRHQPAEGLMPVYRGADIGLQGIRPPDSFIPNDLSLYQQVAPVELYEASEKLIYKFISSHLRFHVDREQRYMLNSANMLVPSPSFPITADQLAALLNSRFINWLFQRTFNTSKILRSDLETLPLHISYFKNNKHFSEAEYLEHIGIKLATDGTYRIKA